MKAHSPVRADLTVDDWFLLAERRIDERPELQPFKDDLLDHAVLESDLALAYEWVAVAPLDDVLAWGKYLAQLATD